MNSSSAVAGTPSHEELAPVPDRSFRALSPLTATGSPLTGTGSPLTGTGSPLIGTLRSLLAGPRAWLLAGVVVILAGMTGCQPKPSAEPLSDSAVTGKASDVPLRIRVVGDLTDPAVLERRWLAESEQPIDIQAQSLDEFLADDENATDVLLFPSRLLGELVQRDWILKLPELPQPLGVSDSDASEDSGGRSTSVAADTSSRYGGTKYAIPLGCSVPQFVASSSLVMELSGADDKQLDPQVDLFALREWLTTTYGSADNSPAAGSLPTGSTAAAETASMAIDRDALVDRFIALMLHFSERDPQYGLLFDIDSLKPRIASQDGLQAAEFLRLMLQQEGGVAAVFGSHDAAWSWAANHERPVVAIAAASMLGPETRQIAMGQELRVGSDKYINVGQGLLVGVSSNCRQTLQSLNFIAWLSRPSTTQVLAPLTRGVDPARPLSMDASAWRLRQNLAEALSSDRLPQEPRFPAAQSFRDLIADALLATLRDGQAAETALVEAEQKWQATATAQEPEKFERAYKTSLGLRSR